MSFAAAAWFAVALGHAALAADAAIPRAQPPTPHQSTLALRYDVYVGGFYIFAFDATLRLDPGAYAVAVQGGTAGMIGRLFTWRTRMTSDGKAQSTTPAPSDIESVDFDNVTEWHAKPKRTRVRFDGGGRYSVEHDPPEPAADRDSDGDALPAALPAGTMDPVTASVAALAASARDGACERRLPVFDGKRRYDLIVRDGDGPTTLMRSHLSAYSGPALSCRIAIRRISGFPKNRRYAHYWDDKTDNMPTIWAAKLAPNMPLVPVRFLASINFGTMIIHLVHAEVRDGNGTRVLADISDTR